MNKLTFSQGITACIGIIFVTCILFVSIGFGQSIIADQTMGTIVTPGEKIEITGGTYSSNHSNLFHSFQQFNLNKNETALFKNNPTYTSVQNIISRITGGSPSQINGKIESDISNANLYLLNPQGIMFGESASFDIQGSLYISTADYIKFKNDNKTFYSTQITGSELSIEPPETFGFLGSPKEIKIEGGDSRITIEVKSGKTLSLIGGDIQIAKGSLKAPDGKIIIASVGSNENAAELKIGENEFVFSMDDKFGNISITEQTTIEAYGSHKTDKTKVSILGDTITISNSTIDVSPVIYDQQYVAGDIEINARKCSLIHGSFFAESTGNIGGSISIKLTDSLSMTDITVLSVSGQYEAKRDDQDNIIKDKNGEVETIKDVGTSGTILIESPIIDIYDSQLLAINRSENDGQSIHLRVNTLSLVRTTTEPIDPNNKDSVPVCKISTDTSKQGKGGDITIEGYNNDTYAKSVRLIDSEINIGALGETDNAGDAGKLTIKSDNISLINQGLILSETIGGGKSGEIHIDAKNSVTLSNNSRIEANTMSKESFAEDAGIIDIKAGKEIGIFDNSSISSQTAGSGNSGTIKLVTSGSVTIGFESSVRADAANALAEEDKQLINPSLYAPGNAGNINIQAATISLIQGAEIMNRTSSQGNGGIIELKASQTITISGKDSYDDASSIQSRSMSTETGAGTGGIINLYANNIALRDGAFISSESYGPGEGGNVLLQATELIKFSGTDKDGYASKVYTSSSQTKGDVGGKSGDITIKAASIQFFDGGSVTASTLGPGEGGTIQMEARTVEFSGGNPHGENVDGFGSGVFAQSEGKGENAGKAGDLIIKADRLIIKDGALITNSTLGAGKGGQVELEIKEDIQISGSIVLTKTLTNDSTKDPIPDNAVLMNPLLSQVDFLNDNPNFIWKEYKSGIYSKTESYESYGGEAGKIWIKTPSLIVNKNAEISTSSYGGGKAGDITLDISSLEMNTGGMISSSTQNKSQIPIFIQTDNEDVLDSISKQEGKIIIIRSMKKNDEENNGEENNGEENKSYQPYMCIANQWKSINATHEFFQYIQNIHTIYSSQDAAHNNEPKIPDNITISRWDIVKFIHPDETISYQILSGLEKGEDGATNYKFELLNDDFTFSAIADKASYEIQKGTMVEYRYLNENKTEHYINQGGIQWVNYNQNESLYDIISKSGITTIQAGEMISIKDATTLVAKRQICTGNNFVLYQFGGDAGTVSIPKNDLNQIPIQTQTISLKDKGTAISTSTDGNGNAGDINLITKSLEMDTESMIASSSNSTGFGGKAGKVVIQAEDEFSMNNGAEINTATYGEGMAGDIHLMAMENFLMENGAVIASSSQSNGDGGNAGTIQIEDCENMTLRHANTTINTSTYGHGNAGDIDLSSDTLILENKATISSASHSLGHGGNAGTIKLTNRNMTVRDAGTSISTSSAGKGKAGDITLITSKINLDLNANISSASSSVSPIIYKVDTLTQLYAISPRPGDVAEVVDNGNNHTATFIYCGISTGWIERDQITVFKVSEPNELGSLKPSKGDIAKVRYSIGFLGDERSMNYVYNGKSWLTINTFNVFLVGTLDDRNSLSAKTGDIASYYNATTQKMDNYIYTEDSIWKPFDWSSVSNPIKTYFVEAEDLNSAVMKGNSFLGDRANVIKEDGTLDSYVYTNSGWENATTSGDAGAIFAEATDIDIFGDSLFSTEAISGGGGKISINASNAMYLFEGLITASVQKGFGKGGDITVKSKSVTLNHSIIEANAVEGDGGAIFIQTDQYIKSEDSKVTATSERGNDGTVEIVSPKVDVFKSLVMLPSNFLDATRWVKTPCALRSAEKVSRLIVEGRNAIPTSMEDWQPSPPSALSLIEPRQSSDQLGQINSYPSSHAADLTLWSCDEWDMY